MVSRFNHSGYISVLHRGKVTATDVPKAIKENTCVHEIYLASAV